MSNWASNPPPFYGIRTTRGDTVTIPFIVPSDLFANVADISEARLYARHKVDGDVYVSVRKSEDADAFTLNVGASSVDIEATATATIPMTQSELHLTYDIELTHTNGEVHTVQFGTWALVADMASDLAGGSVLAQTEYDKLLAQLRQATRPHGKTTEIALAGDDSVDTDTNFNGQYIVIGAYTNSAELHKVESIDEGTINLAGSLANGHATDTNVIMLDSATLHGSWFGAAGDGTTDDAPAIQAAHDALAAHGRGTLILDGDTHMVKSRILWTADFCNLIGAYRRVQITTDQPLASLIKVGDLSNGNDNAFGCIISNLTINGGNVATDGMHVERTVQSLVQNCTFQRCVHAGMVLDGTQNSKFVNNQHRFCGVGLYMINGSNNLHVDRCSFSTNEQHNIQLAEDDTYDAHGSAASNTPKQSKFSVCLLENEVDNVTNSIRLDRANAITFDNCGISRGEPVIYIDSLAQECTFVRCKINLDAAAPSVINHGDDNRFLFCNFTGWEDERVDIIHSYGFTYISRCRFADEFRIIDQSGGSNPLLSIVFEPEFPAVRSSDFWDDMGDVIFSFIDVVDRREKTYRAGQILEVAQGRLSLGDGASADIASGSITYSRAYTVVDTEGAVASDDLDTINGGAIGDVVYLVAQNDARTINVNHNGNGGNIRTKSGASIVLDDTDKLAGLVFNGTNWLEM